MSALESYERKHAAILAKYGPKLATFTAKTVEVLEISAGAAVAGVIQGRAIGMGNVDGAKIFGMPADLVLGVGLEAAGHFGLAGAEWSHHLCNFGAGFIAGFASDWGVSWGKKWAEEGHLPLFESKPRGQLGGAGTVAKGDVSPQQMADVLAHRIQP